jgi:hypothetical protein
VGIPEYAVGQESYAYGDDGEFAVELEVKDDVLAADSDSVTISVQNVPPTIDIIESRLFNNAPRTHGFWKQQVPCGTHTEEPITPEIVDFIRANSRVWSSTTTDEICADLENGEKPDHTILEQLRMQLIALWLNVAADYLFIDTPLHDAGTSATTVREFIEEAEDAILANPDPDDPALESPKDVADRINSDADGQGQDYGSIDPAVGVFEGTATDPGSDDLQFEWGIDYGTGTVSWERMVYFENQVGRTDPGFPPGSPGPTFPFTRTDAWVKYFPANSPCRGAAVSCKLVLRVTDDDGGMAEDEDILETGWSADWSMRFTISYQTLASGFVVAIVAVEYLDWDRVVVPIDPWTGQPLFGPGGEQSIGGGDSAQDDGGGDGGGLDPAP